MGAAVVPANLGRPVNLRIGLIPLLLLCLVAPSAAAPPLTTVVATEVAAASPAPITLSDPDGQELTLSALSAKVVVEGPVALTELEIRFTNPQDRTIEGRFSLTLPEGAAVSRFAKEVNGQLMEGEVVERMAAHRAYDAILHQMRDPALLEQDSGNVFSAKIFPIAPRSEVRLVLSYTQVLRREDGVRAYTLPVRGLPTIGAFRFNGRFSALPGEVTADLPAAERSAAGVQHMDVVRSGWTPDKDVRVAWRTSGDVAPVRVIRTGEFYVATFQPSVPVARQAPGPWVFYVDTSASGADGAIQRIAALEAVIRGLPPSAQVEVRAFDQDVVRVAQGSAGTVATSIGAKLRARGFVGGTDLSKVLADATSLAAGTRAVLTTDGVATFGDTNAAHLAEAAHALPNGVTLHALVLGAEVDTAVLEGLVAGRGRIVTVPFSDGLAAAGAAAATRLAMQAGVRFAADDPGAAWVHAVGADDVLPGGEVVVVGRTLPGKEPGPRLSRDGAVVYAAGLSTEAKAGPLVEREAIRAHLVALARDEAGAASPELAAALAAEQVRLSVAHRVLCPKTTMLVLETEEDYARFGLDRRALADILAVGPDGIATVARPGVAGQPVQPVVERTEEPSDRRKQKTVSDEGEEAKKEAGPGGGEAMGAAMEMDDIGDMEKTEEAPAEEAEARPQRELARSADAAPASSASGRASARPRSTRDTETRTANVAARPAPAPQPDMVVARPPEPVVVQAPSWALPVEVASTRMADLEAAVARDPRDRGAYNQLADALLATQRWSRLGEVARAWQPYDPENPHVYEVMGEAALATGDRELARRAFASLAEVAGGKPELLQRAGLLLWRAGDPVSAEVPLRRALELRPDRVNAHRHLAFVLRAGGRYAEAADVLEAALKLTFPDYYRDVHRVLREELAGVLREWRANKGQGLDARAKAAGVDIERVDQLRVTLAWETDANDVDLHVVDPSGEECFYSHQDNRSGLELYEDITQGLGPEVIRGDKLPGGKYSIGVKYFSAGPMGVSRGLVIVEERGEAPRVEPFRLVEGGGDVRLVGTVEL